MKKKTVKYTPGMFHQCKIIDALDFWDDFPDLMWGLGFEMDACNSFEEYAKKVKLKKNLKAWAREGKRNILYVLEHAPRQIVGNYLFSMWRYYTHWSDGYDHYDVDFLRRIIRILEEKFEEECHFIG